MYRSRSSAHLVEQPTRVAIVVVVAAWGLAACGGAQKRAAPPACPRDAKVAAQEDIAALATCASFESLTIRTGAPLDLAPLAKLETIERSLTIGPTLAIDHVSFPALREVGELTIQSNALLRGVFLPALASASRVTIAGNGQVTTVSLPRLARVQHEVRIEENGSLEIVDLTLLAQVESLGIVNNPVLTTLELPSTIDVQHRVIEGNRALGELQPSVPSSGGGDHE